MLKKHSQVAIQNMSQKQYGLHMEKVYMKNIAGPHTSCGRVFFPLKLFIIFKIFQ